MIIKFNNIYRVQTQVIVPTESGSISIAMQSELLLQKSSLNPNKMSTKWSKVKDSEGHH